MESRAGDTVFKILDPNVGGCAKPLNYSRNFRRFNIVISAIPLAPADSRQVPHRFFLHPFPFFSLSAPTSDGAHPDLIIGWPDAFGDRPCK